MKKTLAFTASLLIFCAILGVMLLLGQKEINEKKITEELSLQIIEPESIFRKITIKRENDTIIIERMENSNIWEMTSPQSGMCETVYINQLLGDLYQVQKDKIIEETPTDLLQYELEKPRGEYILEFINKDNPITLLVGKFNYNHDSLYAKLSNQDQVFLTTDLLDRYIISQPSAFRSKSLLFNHPSQYYSVQINITDPFRVFFHIPKISHIFFIFFGGHFASPQVFFNYPAV